MPALVVDLLSRRRDRKIRRIQSRDAKEIRSDISDTQDKIKQTRSQLESETTSLRNSLKSRTFDRVSSDNNAREQIDKSIPPLVALEKEMEQQRKELAEKQRKTERLQAEELQRLVQEREAKETKKHKETKTVVNQNSEIQPDLQIDHETTPEKTFDRRHEVLDRKTNQPKFDARSFGGNNFEGAPVPISQILSERATANHDSKAAISNAKHPSILRANPDEIYKRSLKSGFYVGVVIIVIGAIAYVAL